ncbi:MAG: hypothetical protein WC269_00215 [Candidatus Gracilibacteria bacterium]|jgi:tetratricopeptide (TPR) repeat protein
MAEKNPYLTQLESKIRQMISMRFYKDAYDLCKKVLEKLPENRVFLDLKKEIENEVREENIKIVDKKIKEMKILLKEERYDDILHELRPVLETAPTKKLIEFYRKVQNLYKDKREKEKLEKFKKLHNNFESLLKNDQNKLLDSIFTIEKNSIGNMEIQNMVKKYKKEIINRKISENMDLINSDKYKEIVNFLQQLKRIDPLSADVRRIERKIKIHVMNKQEGDRKETIYKGINYMENLIKMKKYDKALKIGDELLDMDKNNSMVKKLIKKADGNLYKQTKTESIKSIILSQKELDSEYSKDKIKFVEI